MTREFNFTVKRLAELPVSKSGRVAYRDMVVRGLMVRIGPSGKRACYVSRKVAGEHVKLKLGDWPDDFRGSVKRLRDAPQTALPSASDIQSVGPGGQSPR